MKGLSKSHVQEQEVYTSALPSSMRVSQIATDSDPCDSEGKSNE